MNRRNFFALTLSVATMAMIEGCGGGNGGNGGGNSGGGNVNLERSVVPVQVQLPSGLALALDSLRVETAVATAPIDASGNGTISAFTPGQSLGFVLDSAGEMLLCGLVGQGAVLLSVQTTAEMLVFLGMLGQLHIPAAQGVLLDALATDASVKELAATIAAALASNPKALASETPAIKEKLLSVVKNLTKTQVSRALYVSDPGRRSGCEVAQSDGLNTILISNRYRLRRRAFINRLSYVSDQNQTVTLPTPDAVGEYELSPTKEVTGIFSGISDSVIGWFGYGDGGYAEVATSPITLSVDPQTAKSTTYDVLIVGPGNNSRSLDRLTPQQKQIHNDLKTRAFVGDFLVPILLNVCLPLKDLSPKATEGLIGSASKFVGDASTDITKFIGGPLTSATEKAVNGDLPGAIRELAYGMSSSDAVRNGVVSVVSFFAQTYIGATGNTDEALKKASTYEGMMARLGNALKYLGIADAIVSVVDTATQFVEWTNSEQVERWPVTVNSSKITLSPDLVLVQKGAVSEAIKVVVTDGKPEPGQSYEYRWRCGGGTLTAGAQTGAEITSSSNTVTYSSSAAGGTDDTVSVTVYLKGSGAPDVPLGTASTKVRVIEVKITPSEQKLKAKMGEKATFTAELVGMRPLKTGEEIKFRWLSTRSVGELLDSPDGGTSVPVEGVSATYLASGKEGADFLTAEAFLGLRTLGKNTAKVTVGKETVVVAGRFQVLSRSGTAPQGYPYTFTRAFVIVPRVANAKSYTIRGTGFNDPAFYQTSLTLSLGAEPLTLPDASDDFAERYMTEAEAFIAIAGVTGNVEDIPANTAAYEARFRGIEVEVTAQL